MAGHQNIMLRWTEPAIAGIRNARIRVPAIRGGEYVAHLYVIVCEEREKLRAHLAGAGIMTDVHFPVPDHRQSVLGAKGAWPALPVSESLSQRVLTLPCYPELTNEEVDFVIGRVNDW